MSLVTVTCNVTINILFILSSPEFLCEQYFGEWQRWHFLTKIRDILSQYQNNFWYVTIVNKNPSNSIFLFLKRIIWNGYSSYTLMTILWLWFDHLKSHVMFGLLVSGRLVDTSFRQVNVTLPTFHSQYMYCSLPGWQYPLRHWRRWNRII